MNKAQSLLNYLLVCYGAIKMNWIWKSSIAKSLIITFIFVLIPIIIFGLAINYSSMKVATNEITTSYSNSIICFLGIDQSLYTPVFCNEKV